MAFDPTTAKPVTDGDMPSTAQAGPVASRSKFDPTTARPMDADAPGPWPGVTAPPSPVTKPESHSALGHIASAMGGAFKGPYGPSKETMAPLVEGNPILGAINQTVIGGGATALDAISRPFEAAKHGIAAGGSEIARALGAGETTQKHTERDLNLMGDVAMTLGGAAPAPTSIPKPGRMSGVGRINASDQAKETIRAGFVLPPAEASVGHIGEANLTNMAAGEAGKIKLGQLAAAKNQPLVNVYARNDLGLPPDVPLSPQAFRDVRAREGRVYQEVVNAVPEVDLARNPQFARDVSGIGARSAETERLFPSTTEPPGITALRDEMMRNSRGSTQSVMDYIADLRKNASANFQKDGDAMAHRFGAAQREAAHVLEDAMERSVENSPQYYREKLDQAVARRAEIDADIRTAQPTPGVSRDPTSSHERMLEGLRDQRVQAEQQVRDWSNRLADAHTKNDANQTLLDRFRAARQTMAKSYDVESVTNVSTGDVSARGLGKLLQQGKPLTGGLKIVADGANSFHRAFQNPASFGGVESYSVLDAAAAASMALAGHPVAATVVGARPLIRGRVLSPRYQRRMISEPEASSDMSIPLSRAGALTAGANDLRPQSTSDTANALGGPR